MRKKIKSTKLTKSSFYIENTLGSVHGLALGRFEKFDSPVICTDRPCSGSKKLVLRNGLLNKLEADQLQEFNKKCQNGRIQKGDIYIREMIKGKEVRTIEFYNVMLASMKTGTGAGHRMRIKELVFYYQRIIIK